MARTGEPVQPSTVLQAVLTNDMVVVANGNVMRKSLLQHLLKATRVSERGTRIFRPLFYSLDTLKIGISYP